MKPITDALTDARLPHAAVRLYCFLREAESIPTVIEMSELVHVRNRTVYRALRQLEDCGYLAIQRRGKHEKYGRNQYAVL